MCKLLFSQAACVEQFPCLSLLIRKGDPIETFGFPDLHIAVLRLDTSSVAVDQIALTPRTSIDQQDSVGRTALSWAAELGDADQIRRLLMKGADPNATDLSGATPLLNCACNARCLTLLLEAGANVDQVDNNGQTKFLRLIRACDDPTCLETLWIWGADLNYRSCGYTPVLYTVQSYRPRTLKWLLDHGVDFDARRDRWEDTPLLNFLECSCDDDGHGYPDMLEMLLEKKPNILATNPTEEGILHYIARFSRAQYMKIFLQMMDLSDLDIERRSICSFKPYEKSNSGKTALELATWRRDHQLEWSHHCAATPDPDPQAWFADFESFIGAIRAAHDAKTRTTVDGDVEIFPSMLKHHVDRGESTNVNYGLFPGLPGAYPQA